jgi:hypothetical protein
MRLVDANFVGKDDSEHGVELPKLADDVQKLSLNSP